MRTDRTDGRHILAGERGARVTEGKFSKCEKLTWSFCHSSLDLELDRNPAQSVGRAKSRLGRGGRLHLRTAAAAQGCPNSRPRLLRRCLQTDRGWRGGRDYPQARLSPGQKGHRGPQPVLSDNKAYLPGNKELEPLKYCKVAAAASVSRQKAEGCIQGTVSLLSYCLGKGENVAFVLRDIGVLLIEGTTVKMEVLLRLPGDVVWEGELGTSDFQGPPAAGHGGVPDGTCGLPEFLWPRRHLSRVSTLAAVAALKVTFAPCDPTGVLPWGHPAATLDVPRPWSLPEGRFDG
ncbi:uncharacterized protein LOC141933951 [Strix aluco]|uniref:uncharacterized protein LOC141933948 n=1 Tax=Strix aluco TaxID=111821 RepID=UPI003DA66105